MKINRCFYLLALSLLICFIRADCVSIAAQADPLIQTDKKIYSVTLTPRSFQVEIKWTFTNRTSATVYQGKGDAGWALEKKVGDEWVVAKVSSTESTSPEEFVSINPGGTYAYIWGIKGSYLGNLHKGRRFELKEVPGTYRIVLDLYSTNGGDILAGMLPLEERVSNEFEIVKNE
jgi:hypothetical protein